MNTIRKCPWLFFTVLVLICYAVAEFIIRGKALNDVTYGFAGWFFWAGLVLLLLHVLIIPIFQFTRLPKWPEPETMDIFSAKLDAMEKYGSALVKRYKKTLPKSIENDVLALRDLIQNHPHDPADYAKQLEPLVKRLHNEIFSVPVRTGETGKVTTEIIHDYMKRTALIVAISQRGTIDAAAMLIMQTRMVIDLCKVLGYRPSWLLVSRCLCWILVNSLLFALLDSTDLLDDALSELIPEILKEGTLGFFAKMLGKSVLQGLTAMAVVYSSGVIVRNILLGEKKRLSGKERLENRLQGYKEARNLLAKTMADSTFSWKKKDKQDTMPR